MQPAIPHVPNDNDLTEAHTEVIIVGRQLTSITAADDVALALPDPIFNEIVIILSFC